MNCKTFLELRYIAYARCLPYDRVINRNTRNTSKKQQETAHKPAATKMPGAREVRQVTGPDYIVLLYSESLPRISTSTTQTAEWNGLRQDLPVAERRDTCANNHSNHCAVPTPTTARVATPPGAPERSSRMSPPREPKGAW